MVEKPEKMDLKTEIWALQRCEFWSLVRARPFWYAAFPECCAWKPGHLAGSSHHWAELSVCLASTSGRLKSLLSSVSPSCAALCLLSFWEFCPMHTPRVHFLRFWGSRKLYEQDWCGMRETSLKSERKECLGIQDVTMGLWLIQRLLCSAGRGPERCHRTKVRNIRMAEGWGRQTFMKLSKKVILNFGGKNSEWVPGTVT